MNDIFSEKLGISDSEPVRMLAPMEGVTNHLFRNQVCELGGAHFVATEFIRITSGQQRIGPLRRHDQRGVALQIQLMANMPETLRSCISHLKVSGVLLADDWLDLNVGCPSKKVNARGAGAALLLDPEKLLRIIEDMREVHSGPLSIKTRPAFEQMTEFPRLLSTLKNAPLDFITIHARPRCFGHEGPVHLEVLEAAVDALPYPVIGNGEIWTPEDATLMIQRTGVRGIMCGRGMLRDPYLIHDISNRTNSEDVLKMRNERKALLIQFILNLCMTYQTNETKKRGYTGTFKEFAGWISKNPLIGKQFFEAIKREQTMADLKRKSELFFDVAKSPAYSVAAP